MSDLTDDQRQIIDAIERICSDFDETYWLKCDREARFPHDFAAAMAADGWLGIAMPEAYGGAGLGITEAALMMGTIAASGAAMSGCSAVHMNIFGPNPIVVFGTDEQKARMLPPLIRGEQRACFGVTEPDTGL
ncbi:MAG: acyl-CoA dehydrogenase family protein, partial [Alphaproteobacteria bacterium]